MYLDVTDDFEFGGVVELGVTCSNVICEDDLFWYVGWFSVDMYHESIGGGAADWEWGFVCDTDMDNCGV
jgi:hypothetical protein